MATVPLEAVVKVFISIYIDFDRESGEHIGKVMHGQQIMLLNAQSTALTFKKFFDRDIDCN